ncbi:MAG: MFS transporter, partial [Acidobacteria bacterium]|nr:MFS transporter [Acidobacteriota bacterium]
ILIGATSSAFGPLLSTFAQHFHLSLASAGSVLSVYFIGGVLGIPPAWWAMKRISGRALLSTGMVTIGVGALAASVMSYWSFFLAGIFVIGLGFGALDIGLNSLLSRTALRGRAQRLSVANAGFGVGAVLCPVAIIVVGPTHFANLFAGVAAVAIVLAFLTGGIVAPATRVDAPRDRSQAINPRRRAILITFAGALILYVAVESSTAGWIAAQLHDEGYSKLVGSLVTAGFWSGLALGRFLGGPLHRHFSHQKLILGGLTLAALFCLAALSRTLAPVAYPLLGLVVASVFAMGLLWYTTLIPNDNDGLSLMFLMMMLGGAAGPGLMSVFVSAFGLHVVPLVIASYAALDFAVFLSARRFTPFLETSRR